MSGVLIVLVLAACAKAALAARGSVLEQARVRISVDRRRSPR
jgi:hypothetical protein